MSRHREGREIRSGAARTTEPKVPLQVEQLKDGSLLLSLPEGPRGRTGPAGQQGIAGTGGSGAPTDIGCRIYRSTNQVIPNASDTVITFDGERYDTDNMHSTVSNTGRITFNTAGRYHITASIMTDGAASGQRIIYWRLNGTTQIAAHSHGTENFADAEITLDTIYTFNINDYVELLMWQTTGGNLTLFNFQNTSLEAAAQLLAAT